MNRLSSRSTYVIKKIFPIIVFVFLAIFLIIAVRFMIQTGEVNLLLIFIPLGVGVANFIFMKTFARKTIDEVWDCGDYLLLKSKGVEEKVLLADILEMDYTYVSSLPHVTLSLRNPTAFGEEVSFTPPIYSYLIKADPILEKLIKRISKVNNEDEEIAKK